MKLEKTGKQVLFNGISTTRKTIEQLGRKYFSSESWERLMRDLNKYGRVHAATVFADSVQALERPKKKIAVLEKALEQLTIQNLYLKKE